MYFQTELIKVESTVSETDPHITDEQYYFKETLGESKL